MSKSLTLLRIANALRRARLLLKDSSWTQGHWAEDFLGEPVHPQDPRARRFCLLGAVIASNAENPDSFEDYSLSVGTDKKQAIVCNSKVAISTRCFLESVSNPIEFNDAPDRRKADVLVYLRKHMWKAFFLAFHPWGYRGSL